MSSDSDSDEVPYFTDDFVQQMVEIGAFNRNGKHRKSIKQTKKKNCNEFIGYLERDISDALKQQLVYYVILNKEFDEDSVFAFIKTYVPHVVDIRRILWTTLETVTIEGITFSVYFEPKNLGQSKITDYLLEIYPPSTYDDDIFNKFIQFYIEWTRFDVSAIDSLVDILTESNAKLVLQTFDKIISKLEPQLEDLADIVQLIEVCLDKMDNVNLGKCCYNCVFNILWDSDNINVSLYEQILNLFETRGYIFDACDIFGDTSCANFASISYPATKLEFIGLHTGPEAICEFLVGHLTEVDEADSGNVLSVMKYLASKDVSFADCFKK
jgi:hypothetical protein